ncbi:hypothetical protein [Herbidospora yilanensis]|uniref:hypothetical protein n=1 Tax=Herbidospora yilanensis TaxID=354426 RepID=UPI000782326B|nr:hypothetical protein [Herbidospora yilanensis]
MNDVIFRLKDATTAVGDTISEAPPLRLEEARKGFLVPLAAALAVGLAIVGSVVMTRGGLNQTVASTAAPRFIVEAREQSELIVRGAADGAELDRVEATTGWLYQRVQAALDNRTFYALMNGPGFCSSRIVRFTVDDAGRAGTPAEVPVRPGAQTRISSFTVSGDGTKVVFGTVPCAPDADGRGHLVVADARSGEGRRVEVRAGSGFASISASDDGSKIAYTTMSAGPTVVVSEPAVVVASPPVSQPAELSAAPPGAPTPSSSVAPRAVGSAPPGVPTPSSSVAPRAIVSVPPGVPTAFISVSPADVVAPSGGARENAVIVPMPTPSTGPSGDVVVVVPSAEPSPSGEIVVYTAPTAVPPTLGTLEGVSSCRFFAVRGNGQVPADRLRVIDCADSPEVYVLDADQPATPPRRVLLSGELDGAKVQFYGVRMSPDGTRLIAGVSTGMARLDDPQAAVMAFDPAGGEPAEVLYRGRSWLRVLDLAGGTRVLVQSEHEIGEVSEGTYRKVMDIPGRVMDGVVAW